MEDKRFSHIAADPKFRRIPKGERKVKIDKRFQSMFNDKKFKVKYTTDKRGRPVNHSTNEDLKRYYELSSEDEDSSDDEADEDDTKTETDDSNVQKKTKKTSKVDSNVQEKTKKSSKLEVSDDLNAQQKGDKKIPDKIRNKLKNLCVDYARGEGNLASDSSSDDEESEEEVSDTEGIDHKWGELDADADRTDDATCRLAACNMDWDRIRSVDLMVLLNSFLPPGGVIKSVQIYPSEYGKQRMADEEVKGPMELVEHNKDDRKDENADGATYHMEKLRQYQLNRLKYYYAVITCDNINTASKLYAECDGIEYESSSTKMDLRFIPEDMEFDDEPKESCDKIPENYKPRFFTTTALQQAKVDLTWDETNPDRLEITEKLASGKIDEVTDIDLQAYLASSSGEEESDDDKNNLSDEDDSLNPIDKYKALLQEIETKEEKKKNKDVEMEISWGIDLEAKSEKLVKKKIAESENKTPFQQYLDKRKEKRKEKKQVKKSNEDEDSESDLDVDMNDPYFAEEFDKPEFKQQKPKKKQIEVESDSENEQKQAELELLLSTESDNKKHFSLKKIQDQENDSKSKKKRKGKKQTEEKVEEDFKINVDDNRFSALYTSHHYNIDPTDPHYKKTKAMETLISEKLKRRDQKDNKDAKRPKLDNKNAKLNVLVKSVKRKAQAWKK